MDFEFFQAVQAYRALSKDSLTEELSPKHQSAANKMVGSGHDYYNRQFINGHAEPGTMSKFIGGRMTIPLSINDEIKHPHPEVKQFIEGHGYTIDSGENYKRGIAHKTEMVGNPEKGIPMRERKREYNIGKLLERHKANDTIKSAFQNDPARKNANSTDYDLVISHHPHDVYGMSTGRSWTSCTDMDTRAIGTTHMKDEINNHTHVAYLVRKGGDVDKDAIARIKLSHHTSVESGHQTLIPETRVYGTAPDSFHSKVDEIVKQHFPRKNELYIKEPSIYNDNGKPIHVAEGMNVDPKQLKTAWTTLGKKHQDRLHQYVEPNQKYGIVGLNRTSKALGVYTTLGHKDFAEDIRNLKDHDLTQYKLTAHHIITQRPDVRESIARMGKNFDVNNTEHVAALTAHFGRSSSDLRGQVYHAVGEKYNKPVHNAQEYGDVMKLHEYFGNMSAEKIQVADNHTMGNDIMKHLSEHGVIHDHNTFHKAYYSVPENDVSNGMNYFGMAADYHSRGLNGGQHVMNGALSNFKSRVENNPFGNTESRAAEMLYKVRPEHRHIFADHVGIPMKDIEPHFEHVAKKYNWN